MKIPDTNKVMSIAMLIGLIVVVFVIYKILSGIGLIKTAAKKKEAKDEANAKESLRTEDYFNPSYYKDKKFKSIGSNAANLYAQYLKKALSGIGTDEELIFATFGKIYNKCNISEIAASYYLQYGKDLQGALLGDLSDSETLELMTIINRLPNT